MSKFSTFTDFSTPKESLTMLQIIDLIKNGQYSEKVNQIRKTSDEDNRNTLKQQLPSFTPSGLFENSRKEINLVEYSNIIHLDFDKLSKDELSDLQNQLKQNIMVYAFFISPSGNGVKVFFKVNSTKKEHRKIMENLFHYAESEWKVIPDKQCIDLARLCFLSYDTDAYLNEDSDLLTFSSINVDDRIDSAYSTTKLTREYKRGTRNNFVWEFGRQCKSLGMSFEETFRSSITKFTDLEKAEIYRTIRSSYMGRYDLPVKQSLEKHGFGKYSQIENHLKKVYDFRFNLITGCVESKKKNQKVYQKLTDNDFNNLRRYLDLEGCRTSKDDLHTILYSAFCEQYNPFLEYFDSLPEWDGYDHIGDLASTVEVQSQAYFEKCLKKWLIGTIASVLNDEIVNQHVLVLVGEQSVGKTTWLNNLYPKQLEQYVYNGSINVTDKDSLIMLSESMIINVDELEALSRRQVEQFKELITKLNIRVRRPYGRLPENMPRRASFCASLNNKEFLNDPTGSRRFLVHEVVKIDNEHELDINLVYSHALHLYLNGTRYWFERDEIIEINTENRSYQVESKEEELLLNYFEKPLSNDQAEYMSAMEIVIYIQERCEGIRLQNIPMGKMLRKNGFIQTNRNSRKKWMVKKVSK